MPKDLGFPRGEWLERKIGKAMDYMGFAMGFGKPYIEDYWRCFLTLAHLQGRLQGEGTRDRRKVREFFAMLLRHRRESKCERRLRAATADMIAQIRSLRALGL